MPSPIVLRAAVMQASPAWVMGYLTAKVDGVEMPLSSELVSAIAWAVFRHADGAITPATSGSAMPGDVLLEPVTNATDSSWPAIYPLGYNFQHELPASAFPVGATLYELQYTFTMVAGGTWCPAPIYLTTIPNQTA